jgi:deoxyribodipyrimidine photo-lyase
MTTALWWVRRDQRLTDNQALVAALQRAELVIPVFVLDPVLLESPDAGEKRVAFMLASLRQLDADLRARGSRLIIRRGNPAAELANLVRETGAEAIFAEEDCWPYAQRRDRNLAEALPLHLTGGLTVHPPAMVRKADGAPYTVFTPFSRTWRALPLPETKAVLAAPKQLPMLPELYCLAIPAEPAPPPDLPFPPGEAEAWRRLQSFVDWDDPVAYGYAEGRNRLDLEGTSQLSPYLRFGMLSARQAVVSALSAMDAAPDERSRKGAEIWLKELPR